MTRPPPQFVDHRSESISTVRGVLIGMVCGLCLWGILIGFALLLASI